MSQAFKLQLGKGRPLPASGVALPRPSCWRAGLCRASVSAPVALHSDIGKVLYSQEQLQSCVERLGSQIGQDYVGKHVLLVGVLKGGYMFSADLARSITPVPPIMEVDFLKASSYGLGRLETTGRVKIDDGFDLSSCQGKHVLVVEDIVDSGLTLSAIVELLKSSGQAASVKVCALLDKRARRKVQFEADYVGFECPDEFVVGYGIDYSEMYRFLPYIGVPTPEAVARVAAEALARQQRQQQPAAGISSDDEGDQTGGEGVYSAAPTDSK